MFVDEDEGKTMKMMRTKTRMRIRMRMMMMMMVVMMMMVMLLVVVVVMSHHQHIPINACEEHDRIFARFPTEREPREMCTRMAIQNQPCWATRQISIFVIERLHFKKTSPSLFKDLPTVQNSICFFLSATKSSIAYCEYEGPNQRLEIKISNPQSDDFDSTC